MVQMATAAKSLTEPKLWRASRWAMESRNYLPTSKHVRADDRICCLDNFSCGCGGIRRFGVSSFCLRWYIGNGKVAKVTDEERQKLCANLRAWFGDMGVDDFLKAADEIERLEKQVITWQEGCDIECKRAEKAERRINELLEFCETLRRERDEARSAADRSGK
jgi:hypothetical protein